MFRSQAFRFIVAVSLALGVTANADAYLTTMSVNKCLAGKLKAQGKGIAAYTNCHAKQAAKPDAAKLATCLVRAGEKVTKAYGKLDAKYPGGCAGGGNGDGTARQQDAAAFGDQVNADVGAALGKCDAAKQRCVGKYVAAILGCYAKAANKGGVVSNGPGSCTAKAMAKLFDGTKGCLDKAAANGDCSHAGNQAALLGGDGDAVSDGQSCLLDPAAGGCGGPVVCPATVEFAPDVDDPRSNIDFGWYWIGRDKPFGSGGLLTMAITGPSGSDCAFAGPIANVNANAGALDNQRCTDNTSVHCSNAPGGLGGPCAGLGTCEFFWSPPLPIYLGGLNVCVQDRVAGPAVGTVNPASGAVARTLPIERELFGAITLDSPCPRCLGDGTPNDGVTGGICNGGQRNGLSCDANGSIAAWPDSNPTSLDCPPSTGSFIVATTQTLDGSTGTTSITLTTASPSCTAGGYTAKRCACDTCNNIARETCTSNADCPVSDGQPGLCGGRTCSLGADDGLPCRTCVGGANDTGFCLGASACPGGACVRAACAGGAVCSRAGEPTAPNNCQDDTSTGLDESLCVDTAPLGDHDGRCSFGPVHKLCRPSSGHPQRECGNDSDCCDDQGLCMSDPVTPGDCSIAELASCYLDNGIVGNSITSEGIADPPGGTIATPKVTSLSCGAPSPIVAFNIIMGLPGATRLELVEKMRLRP